MRRKTLIALLAATLTSSHAFAGGREIVPPFELTELEVDRPRCDHYTPRKQPLFGTTHLHTGLSFDASIRFVDFGAGNTPRRAYRFAKGGVRVPLPSPSGFQDPLDELRNPMIDRPLDWGAVTDHSEHFGAMGICKDFVGRDVPERIAMECRMINAWFYQPGRALNPLAGRTLASNAFTQLTIASLGGVSKLTRLPFCEANPELCDEAELRVWAEHRNAARAEYDRSSDCEFTTFVAYENTSTPVLNNWHRNVIFRNDRVVRSPVTALDMAVRVNENPTSGGPTGLGEPIDLLVTTVPDEPRVFPVPPGTIVNHPLPQPFWNKLESDCTRGGNVTRGLGTRCDFLTIPHNSNLGGGLFLDGLMVFPPMFLDPYNPEDARRHARFEPLVEIYQDKGSSECRWDPRFADGVAGNPDAGVETRDEFCAFEILDSANLGGASGVGGLATSGVPAPSDFGERAYVRNVLKDGLEYASGARGPRFEGINPFKLGIVGASDSHTGVMGWHPENADWPGHLGIADAFPVQSRESIQNSTGGHTVVWAEENSRDSIFHALQSKEVYATSGTRPIVRFFGGWEFGDEECRRDFVASGYGGGVPMGGDLPERPNANAAPRFVAAAWRDDFIRTKLQQIQIVKGWVDATGAEHERVYSVAGDDVPAAEVRDRLDPRSCKAKRRYGSNRLCGVWQDPDFDPDEYAFYYVRLLEEPVCRYSTLWCRERIGVDPLDHEQCIEDLAALQGGGPRERLRASRGAACCSFDGGDAQTNQSFVQPVIQERAWTSPIWYEPGP